MATALDELLREVGEVPSEAPGAPSAPAAGPVGGTGLDALLAEAPAAAPAPSGEPGFLDAALDFGKRGAAATREFLTSREGARTLGALTGGALAAPAAAAAGPLGPAVELAGIGLGSAAGQLTFDTVQNAINYFRGLPQEAPDLATTATQAAEDVVFGAGGAIAGEVLRAGGRTLGRILGLNRPEATANAAQAARTGIDVGALSASATPQRLRKFSRAFGVFPFSGMPITKQVAKADEATERAINDLLDTLAPTQTVAATGVDLTRAAGQRFLAFKRLTGNLYARFEQLVRTAGNPEIVPTDAMRQQARELLAEIEAGSIRVPQVRAGERTTAARTQTQTITSEGSTSAGTITDNLSGRTSQFDRTVVADTSQRAMRETQRQVQQITTEMGEVRIPGADTDEIRAFLTDMANLPERITVTQFRKLQRDMNDALGKRTRDGYSIRDISKMRAAAEQDFANLDVSQLPAGQGQQIIDALRAANETFANGSRIFETPTAARFKRADPDIFDPTRSFRIGSREADTMFADVFRTKSPQALEDLRALVGHGPFNRAARQFVEREFKASMAPALTPDGTGKLFRLDAAGFRKRLGLDDAQGRATMARILGADRTNLLTDILDAAERAGKVFVPDGSVFLARHITLSGSRGIANLLTAGAAVADPVLTGTMLLVVNRMSALLASPRAMRLILRTFDQNIPLRRRGELLGIAARAALSPGEALTFNSNVSALIDAMEEDQE